MKHPATCSIFILAFLALSAHGEIECSETLRRGSKGDCVKTVQLVVGEAVDGDFAALTHAAVVAFQQRNNLTANGVVDARTWAKIKAQIKSNAELDAKSNPATARTPAQCSETLRRGSKGECVKAVQRVVGEVVDGDFAALTHSAVVAFQQRNNLTADGVVNAATWAKIRSQWRSNAEFAASVILPGDRDPTECTVTLKRGSKGGCVKTIQRGVGEITDGDFGPRTHAAVVAFQQRNNLTANGVVDARTWAKIKAQIKSNAEQDAKSNPATARTPAQCSETLRRGSKGECVKAVQRVVGEVVDGDFAALTHSAVVAFQQRNNLTADGVVNAATWAEIRRQFDLNTELQAEAVPPLSDQGSRECTESLQRGSKGDCVKAVQRVIGELVDGDFGGQTRAALVAFQQRNSLTADGVVDARTWAKIKAQAKSNAELEATSDRARARRPAQCSETLQRGSKGECVKAVQRVVGEVVDGDFAALTHSAVVAFQQRNNLTANGVVNAKTWARIKIQSEANAVFDGGPTAGLASKCLLCLCVGESLCRPAACEADAKGVGCGYFSLRESYYKDCKEWGDLFYGASIDRPWKACAADRACSETCVKNYLARYGTRCTPNPTCTDYALIHEAGPDNCKASVPAVFRENLRACFN